MSALSFLDNTKPRSLDFMGKKVDFYPVSFRCVMMLKKIAPKLSKMLSVVFSDKSKDFGQTNKTHMSDEGNPISSEVYIDAISTETAKARTAQLDSAIHGLLDFLLSDEASNILVAWIWSSTRMSQSNKKEPKTYEEVQEFLEEIDLEQMIALLKCVFEANKGVLGPFSGSLAKYGDAAREKIESSLSVVKDPEETPGE